MKKITFLFLFVSIFNFAQSNFEGIGMFKLGKFSVSDLYEFAKSNNYSIKNCDNPQCYYDSTIINIKPNKQDIYLSPPYASYSENVKVFKLKGYKINNKYPSESIVLSFYKDLLYYVFIDKPLGSIDDDLKLKYGNPILSKTEGIDRCRVGNESFEFPRETYFKNWQNKTKDYEMLYILRSGRDSDCEESITYSLTVFDSKIDKKSKNENNEAMENIKSIIESQKKNDLKDL